MIGLNLGFFVGLKINLGVAIGVKGQAYRASEALIGLKEGGFLCGLRRWGWVVYFWDLTEMGEFLGGVEFGVLILEATIDAII